LGNHRVCHLEAVLWRPLEGVRALLLGDQPNLLEFLEALMLHELLLKGHLLL